MENNNFSIILSAYTVEPIFLRLKDASPQIEISPNLGINKVLVTVDDDYVTFPGNHRISRNLIDLIMAEPQSCFEVSNNELIKIAEYSDYTDRYYSLYPTDSAPTMLLSGIPMHRIKGTNPYNDTLAKIRAANPFGEVLDTTTGLGYTAIEAAKNANHVITIELDPAVIRLCKFNPWSRKLFNHPRISKLIGDSFELINTFPNEYFSCVIHDPPTFSLAGDLYSTEFYEEIYRILKPNGRFFHYIGDPDSKSGRRTTQGVIKRLSKTGFRNISLRVDAFGVLAKKR